MRRLANVPVQKINISKALVCWHTCTPVSNTKIWGDRNACRSIVDPWLRGAMIGRKAPSMAWWEILKAEVKMV